MAEKIRGEIVEMSKLARVFKWPVRRTRSRLKGMGLAFKQGRYWYVSVVDLMEKTPNLWNAISHHFEFGEDGEDSHRPVRGKTK